MTQIDRDRLKVMLLGLADQYGPWSVLWEFTQIMREPFLKQAADEAPPKRQKKNNDAALEVPVFVNPLPIGDERP